MSSTLQFWKHVNELERNFSLSFYLSSPTFSRPILMQNMIVIFVVGWCCIVWCARTTLRLMFVFRDANPGCNGLSFGWYWGMGNWRASNFEDIWLTLCIRLLWMSRGWLNRVNEVRNIVADDNRLYYHFVRKDVFSFKIACGKIYNEKCIYLWIFHKLLSFMVYMITIKWIGCIYMLLHKRLLSFARVKSVNSLIEKEQANIYFLWSML